MHLASIQVGRAQSFEAGGKRFRSAILKSAVDGRVRVLAEGLDGDQQADRRFHGGPEKALLLYAAEHYPRWSAALRTVELPAGTFGENLTIAGCGERGELERELRVGDVLRIGASGAGDGGATIRLTIPRQPCWKLETRMGLPGFAKAFLESALLGSYARVVAQGTIGAGDAIEVVERAPRAATLLDLNRALYLLDRDAAQRVLADDALEPKLRRRVERALKQQPPEQDE